MDADLKRAVIYLGKRAKYQELLEEKEKLEQELETEKYGAPKKEVLKKMQEYFTRE